MQTGIAPSLEDSCAPCHLIANGAIGLTTRMVEPPITPLTPLTTTTAPAVTGYRYDPSTYDLLETDLSAGGVSKQTYNGHHDVASSAQLIMGTTQWQGSLSSYDSQGNLSASTDGRGVTVSANGSGVTANAQATQYTAQQVYNAQGDQTAAGTPPITTTLGGVTSASTAVTTTTGYDSDGNPTNSTTPIGNSTAMLVEGSMALYRTTCPSSCVPQLPPRRYTSRLLGAKPYPAAPRAALGAWST